MTPLQADRPHWTGRFADPKQELDYRRSRLDDDRALGRTLIAGLLGMNLLFIPLDLLSIGPTRGVLLSAAAKGLVVGWCLLHRWRIGRVATPAHLDRGMLAWAVPAVSLDVLAVAFHTPGHMGAAVSAAVGVALAYVLPLPLRLAATVGLFGSVLFVTVLFLHSGSHESRHGLRVSAAGFVLANVLGMAAGRKLHADRRHQYATASALERAAAELRTLRGLLPICGFCKSIRDDAGRWLKLERFISERTPAQFTHTVCGECAVREYGLTPSPAGGDTVTPP